MKHSCDKEIKADSWAMSGTRKEGDKWKCSCGETYVHVCDEANGCYWYFDQSPTSVKET